MQRILFCLIALLFATVSSYASDSKVYSPQLTLAPAKTPVPQNKFQLLPTAAEQSDADALPLYNKAIQALPKNLQIDQINYWIKTPLDKLPQNKVQETLDQLKPTIQLLEQAVKCKHCRWPFEVESDPETLRNYRILAYTLALKARLNIAQAKYDNAFSSFRTALAMARHLGNRYSTLTYGIPAIATAALVCGQLEYLIQAPDSPDIYFALDTLPRPLIDLTKQFEFEPASVRLKLQRLMNRLDRHLAILQCTEALRLYAANHDGKFPNSLTEITEVPTPNDPVTNKPFVYTRTGSQAVLKNPAPEGTETYDAIQFTITFKEIPIEQQSKTQN